MIILIHLKLILNLVSVIFIIVKKVTFFSRRKDITYVADAIIRQDEINNNLIKYKINITKNFDQYIKKVM
jgi:hypothetical protein